MVLFVAGYSADLEPGSKRLVLGSPILYPQGHRRAPARPGARLLGDAGLGVVAGGLEMAHQQLRSLPRSLAAFERRRAQPSPR